MGGSSYSQTSAGASITAANPQPDTKMLKVRWEGGGEDTYPYIWLRDNCQCPACFHPVSLARRVMLKDLNLSVNCVNAEVSNNGEQLEVHWTDGHVGMYSAQWLHERAFRKPRHEALEWKFRLKQEYWGREMQDHLPRASFTELLHDDVALLTLLENMETVGVVVVSGVPCELDQMHRLTKRMGHFKSTHYGETFQVESKSDPNNLAYTADSLDMHTDLSYLVFKPGVQLLHFIKQFTGEGGDTLLTDGFAAALKLRKNNPKHFDILAKTLVDFVDVGMDAGIKFHMLSRVPIIDLDIDGSLRNINWHQMARDSRFYTSSPEETAEWYEAALALRDQLYHPDNLVQVKLQSGDMVILDNLRVMHGRHGYRAELGERLVQGGYWEWDSVRSLRRVLRKEVAT